MAIVMIQINNFPGNVEQCDGQDNNCDALVDDDDPTVAGQLIWYEDQDNDGMGSSVTQAACSQPNSYVSTTGDCDDSNAVIYDVHLKCAILTTMIVMDLSMT